MANLSDIITPSNVLTATNTATLSNKTISGASNTVTNVSLTASVTGALPAANGGTGLTAPGASGNVLQSNGTAWTSAALSTGISNIVTASGNTTLTSTPTLLRITPTNYGTTVTLPDATTMTAGAGKFTIQNLSEFHVRIVDSSKTLLGFVDAFKTVNIDLASAATSAGTWVLNNAVRLGISASYVDSSGLITTFSGNDVRVVELDVDRQIYITQSSGNLLYGQVYDQATNTFGSPTLIRNTTNTIGNAGIEKISSSSVLVVSIPSSGTAGQAVVLSISGTTITVNTAVTFTASAAPPSTGMQFFRAIPNGGFIYGYYSASTSNSYLVPISVSGTTPSIGTEVTSFSATNTTVYAQTASDKLILYAIDDSGNNGGFRAFSLSGNTITSGTRVSVGFSAANGTRFVKLTDTTYFYGANTSGTGSYVGVISLSGLTITNYISSAIGAANSIVNDSISISSTKVFFNLSSSAYYNILTFTGSSITLGTAITTSPALPASSCVALKGTEIVVSTSGTLVVVDVSGSSPAIKSSISPGAVGFASLTDYDGSPRWLKNNDINVFSISQLPTQVTGISFNSPVVLNTLGMPSLSTFSWYSGNNRTSRDNRNMAYSITVTSGSWTILRKIELA